MGPKLHSELVGGKSVVNKEPGSGFSASNGSLRGRTLHVKNNALIVQTWRSSDWGKDEPDSVLVPLFRAKDGGTELDLVHANVPDREAEEIKKGWHEYYWKPWKKHIKGLK
jgi:activator of HSP90 ATPase